MEYVGQTNSQETVIRYGKPHLNTKTRTTIEGSGE